MDLHNILDVIYLVDLENVGHNILYEHMKEHIDAEYIVFCSENTAQPDTVLENIPVSVRVKFTDCITGSNAMDFCICAEAGRLSICARKTIRILSDDKGYDAMLHMMRRQGVRISRESTMQQSSPEPEGHDGNETTLKENTSIVRAIRANVPKKYQEEVIRALRYIPNRKEAHERLQAILPAKMVPDIYKKLRKYIPKEVV